MEIEDWKNVRILMIQKWSIVIFGKQDWKYFRQYISLALRHCKYTRLLS